MRRFIILLGGVAMLSVTPVVPAAPAKAADIIRDVVCAGRALDENGEFIGDPNDISNYFFGTALIRTTKSGQITMTCHYDVPEQFWPIHAVHNRGFECTLPDSSATTTDSRIGISSGGRAVLNCRFHT